MYLLAQEANCMKVTSNNTRNESDFSQCMTLEVVQKRLLATQALVECLNSHRHTCRHMHTRACTCMKIYSLIPAATHRELHAYLTVHIGCWGRI